MKKSKLIICLTAVMIMLTSTVCFAGENFKIDRTYPKNNAKNTTKDNMCVKLYFNNAVGNKASRKANQDKVSITDNTGKKFPTKICYSKKDSKFVLVIIDTTKVPQKGDDAIKDNTKYTCHIEKDFQDNAGNTLGKQTNVSFSTMNQKFNTALYMIMMFAMMGGMVFFSSKQMKKKENEEKDESGKEEPFNPYKVAKKTGKSVEEVLAEHEKELEKKNRKKKKKASTKQQKEKNNNENLHKVHGPAPIAKAGAKYRTGRKAKAERERAEREKKRAILKATDYGKKPLEKRK